MNCHLHRERAYYLAHHDTLSQLYEGKIVVIKGEVVLATYDEAAWAAPKAQKRHGGGSYFVQKVTAVPPRFDRDARTA